jgi:hypothetical protein
MPDPIARLRITYADHTELTETLPIVIGMFVHVDEPAGQIVKVSVAIEVPPDA